MRRRTPMEKGKAGKETIRSLWSVGSTEQLRRCLKASVMLGPTASLLVQYDLFAIDLFIER